MPERLLYWLNTSRLAGILLQEAMIIGADY